MNNTSFARLLLLIEMFNTTDIAALWVSLDLESEDRWYIFYIRGFRTAEDFLTSWNDRVHLLGESFRECS